MRGAELLRGYMSAHLAATVPGLIDVARQQWELTAAQFPYPTRYKAAEPFMKTAETYPYMGSYVISDANHSHVDFSDVMEEEYEPRFTMHAFACVRTPHATVGEIEDPPFEATLRLRNDMTRILHAALLGTPSLGHPDVCELQEQDMSTTYSDAMPIDHQVPTYAAGGFVTVTYKLVEHAHRVKLGDANTINVHPAMLEIDL